jgi:cytoplasmic iron level regulating protein YaaA (DUF328/UPF0246 family)
MPSKRKHLESDDEFSDFSQDELTEISECSEWCEDLSEGELEDVVRQKKRCQKENVKNNII